MSEPSVEVVCDAGPIIHLDELDCLDLLSDFRAAYVPDEVWREVAHHRPTALQKPEMLFQRVTVALSEEAAFCALVQALALDLGEQAALSLMRYHPQAILLTDDAAARLAAEGMGYRAHGTIGILLRAIRRQQRTAQEVVATLRAIPLRSTLHIRPALLEEIIKQVESTG